MSLWKMIPLSSSCTIAPIMSIPIVINRTLFLLKTSMPTHFPPCQNSGSMNPVSRTTCVCLRHKLKKLPMPPCKMMISRFGKFTVHTRSIEIITVSQICNWTNLSSMWTVLDLKSTPTVILYSFRNYPCKYLWISVVLPTPYFYSNLPDSPIMITLKLTPFKSKILICAINLQMYIVAL